MPLYLPTSLAFPMPSHSKHSHPGFVQETWVRGSPRAEIILHPAQPPSVLCLDSACGESQLGTSHGTCRKLEVSVEVVLL